MAKQKLSGFGELGNLVYSTNPEMQKKIETPDNNNNNTVPPKEQNLRVWIEKNHRGGKVATIIKGFEGSIQELKELGKQLKTFCGTGGSEKDGEIILQGHVADKVVKFLIEKGYKAKRAGG
ncbi:MAG: translation initiation factor [Bacteroidetes bacterium HGW-Bacteroidetes-6]|jgi:translation initiation factor 1|nr:MAG: translation initiation factor [Bacteroidetes bacterium HGW-Bacteroidetes-6]